MSSRPGEHAYARGARRADGGGASRSRQPGDGGLRGDDSAGVLSVMRAASQQGGGGDNIICTGFSGQGCRTLLVYPPGATNVQCALCNVVTPVPPSGNDMAQIDCGGCRTRLMYVRGATSVQCSVCNTVNLAIQANQVAHCRCGGCQTTLRYTHGAQSVRCAACDFITTPAAPSTSAPGGAHGGSAGGDKKQRMVVVENPPTLDDAGRTVSNMAVGIADE
eukprot:CAMPEP_0181368832 /NCGR_PEP_ID=MMETSP1106-20121128/12369_1 /TAXON_ID=81844 /ORGANISM="Mantoniella antarctica, Strain SL-175" /LENGTH=219 /DNA_ID=CAMNT_0023485117 /DNA_START=47 /DNA_END=706 /DNA_ORIENTATION=+